MSLRYTGAWMQDGAFNPLAPATPTAVTYYLNAWGLNGAGQLGLGNRTDYSSPKQVGSLTNWLEVAAGYSYFTGATKTDGTLWTWGQNATYGMLGLGNRTNYSSPKQVGALTNWSKIQCGGTHMLSLKTDGTIWTWGNGADSQLGLGNTTRYSSPKQVGSLTNWAFISAKYDTCSAIKTNGTLWGWGRNDYGGIGNGNTTNQNSPVQIGALTNWSKVANAGFHTLAIKTDGTLWSWGNNGQGQLGLNSTTYNFSSPKQVGALTNWANVSANGNFSFAVKTDGTLWSWGSNGSGQLGSENTNYYSSPKQIGVLTNWANVDCGTNFVVARKTDGTLWAWGNNISGQLGLGNRTNFSSPKQIGASTNWGQMSANRLCTVALAY